MSPSGGTTGASRPLPGERGHWGRNTPALSSLLLRASTLVRGRVLHRETGKSPVARPRPADPGPDRLWRRTLPYLTTATFLMVLYLRTLLPSVGYHMDTSKFGYLGQVLGTGHSPGEPLYLILNAAWLQWFPVGTPAWRANLLSAVFGVLACLVLMRVLRELGLDRWVAAAGAATIGVSRLFWQQSIIAEVYSLNAAFTAAVLCLLLAWLRTGKDGLLILALGIFGLSFSNHPTGLFLLPGLLWLLVRTRGYRAMVRARSLAALFGFSVLAVSTYAYIVWRSLDPGTPYLELDMHSWASFWYGVTAADFQGYMFGYGPLAFFTEQVPYALRHFWLQYFGFAAAGVWGLGVLWRRGGRHRQAAVLTGIWALAITIFAMGYQVSDAEVFYFVAWMMLGIWIAVGLQDLITRVPRLVAGRGRLHWTAALPVLITVAAPLVVAGVNYPRVDLSGSNEAKHLASAVAALPQDAIVFTPTFREYQGLNYFLIPGGAGDRKNQYAELGAGSAGRDAERTDIGRIVEYCRDGDPMRLEWIRETVPPDLHTFVYGHGYAASVARLGYPVRHVSGKLYRMSCDRFGILDA